MFNSQTCGPTFGYSIYTILSDRQFYIRTEEYAEDHGSGRDDKMEEDR